MKKAIVTGCAGFIGGQLTKRLLSQGIKVLGIDDFSTGKEENTIAFHENPNFRFICKNLALPRSLLEIEKELPRYDFADADCIFHLAALPRVQPSIDEPMTYHGANVDGTITMLELARKTGIKKFVFSSSSSVYGDPDPQNLPTNESEPFNPMSPYALHKQVGEHYCKLYAELYSINSVALRYFNVYGEGQPEEGAYVPVVGIWMKQHAEGKPLTITGDGTQTRDFVCVDDVVEANWLASQATYAGFHYFNVGSGKNIELNVLAKLISDDIVHIEKRLEPHTTLADVVKAANFLGFSAKVDLQQWIKESYED